MTSQLGKSLFVKTLMGMLAQHGFRRDGNYFRRTVGPAEQALYLEPVRGGGAYWLEMMVTFPEINSRRQNVLPDSHLGFRLDGFYHPLGNPRENQPWRCTYVDLQPESELLTKELPEAIPVFLWWLSEFPSVDETNRKFRDARYLQSSGMDVVMRYEFFTDLGQPVPIPI